MSFRRVPKEIDPRRPPKRRETAGDEGRPRESRSYGQYVDTSANEVKDVEEFEELTGEVAREGDAEGTLAGTSGGDEQNAGAAAGKREEFEELAGEPTRENGERSN